MMIAGLAFGAASGYALDMTRGRFYVQPPIHTSTTPEIEAKYLQEKHAALQRQAALISAIGVGIVAGGLGLAIGLTRGGPINAAIGLILGAGIGAALGAFGGQWGLDFYAHESVSGAKATLSRSAIMQATFWLPAAIALLAAGLGVFRSVSAFGQFFVASALGAAAACVLVPMAGVAALLLTGKDMKDVIPPVSTVGCLTMGLVGAVTLAVTCGLACGNSIAKEKLAVN